jgi:hypothetical protein
MPGMKSWAWMLKFGSRLQVFGSFAHKISPGGFFSSLISGRYKEFTMIDWLAFGWPTVWKLRVCQS